MALKLLTKITELLDAHSTLGDRPNINDGLDSTQLKARYDRDVNRIKTYNNDTLTVELQDQTLNNSGSNTIGHNSTNIAANNVGDALEEVQGNIAGKQDVSNLVTAFQVTPEDTKYPSEKLTKDSLNLKADSTELANYYTKSEVYTKTETQSAINDATFNNLSKEQQFLVGLGYDSIDNVVYNATTGKLEEQEYFNGATRFAREESTYDGNGRLTPFVYKIYDTDGTTIIAQKQFDYTYDGNGRLTDVAITEVV